MALPEHVPETVWRMFETAKGGMVYGLYFYPLYTLGRDHLYRLFEYLVVEQYAIRRAARPTKNLKVKVQWLIDNGHLPGPAPERWLAAYELRNIVSHPTRQSIANPAGAAKTLHNMRDLVVHLYPA